MKTLILLLLATICFRGYSSDTTHVRRPDQDTSTRHRHRNFNIVFGHRDSTSHIAHADKSRGTVYLGIDPGLDLGLVSFLDHGNATLSPQNQALNLNRGKSSNVTLDLLKLRVRLDEHTFRLYSGLGLDWTNYRFANDVTLVPSNALPLVIGPTLLPISSAPHFSKNKLVSTYVRMPLLLKINLSPGDRHNGLFVAGGVEAGYLISSHTKQISHEFGNVKVHNDFYLNPWKTAIQARIGYKDFNIYGKYYLSKVLTKAGVAPDLTSFAIGISFGGF